MSGTKNYRNFSGKKHCAFSMNLLWKFSSYCTIDHKTNMKSQKRTIKIIRNKTHGKNIKRQCEG